LLLCLLCKLACACAISALARLLLQHKLWRLWCRYCSASRLCAVSGMRGFWHKDGVRRWATMMQRARKDRKNKRHFCAASTGAPPGAPSATRQRPHRAPPLGLDTRRRTGERRAHRCPTGGRPREQGPPSPRCQRNACAVANGRKSVSGSR